MRIDGHTFDIVWDGHGPLTPDYESFGGAGGMCLRADSYSGSAVGDLRPRKRRSHKRDGRGKSPGSLAALKAGRERAG